MDRVRAACRTRLPELSMYFQSGGLVDAVLNLGLPAPIDVQVAGRTSSAAYKSPTTLADANPRVPGVSDVFIPQDIDYPVAAARYRPRRARRTGPEPEGSGGQCHHRADLERDDRAQLLDRSEDAATTTCSPCSTRKTQIQNLGDLRSIPLRAADATPIRRGSTP